MYPINNPWIVLGTIIIVSIIFAIITRIWLNHRRLGYEALEKLITDDLEDTVYRIQNSMSKKYRGQLKQQFIKKWDTFLPRHQYKKLVKKIDAEIEISNLRYHEYD